MLTTFNNIIVVRSRKFHSFEMYSVNFLFYLFFSESASIIPNFLFLFREARTPPPYDALYEASGDENVLPFLMGALMHPSAVRFNFLEAVIIMLSRLQRS